MNATGCCSTSLGNRSRAFLVEKLPYQIDTNFKKKKIIFERILIRSELEMLHIDEYIKDILSLRL